MKNLVSIYKIEADKKLSAPFFCKFLEDFDYVTLLILFIKKFTSANCVTNLGIFFSGGRS